MAPAPIAYEEPKPYKPPMPPIHEESEETRPPKGYVRVKHNHYYKKLPVGVKEVDIYRVLVLFGVTDPCLQHAIKKLLVAGGRGAGKDITQDIQEAIDSLNRKLDMEDENNYMPLRP